MRTRFEPQRNVTERKSMKINAHMTGLAVIGGLAVVLAGCAPASAAETEAEREGSIREIEVCLTNSLLAPVDLETKYDGTGKTSVQTFSPGQTECLRSKKDSLLAAEIRPGHETQAYSMRFENFFLGAPEGVLIVGAWRDKGLAPGTCEFLSEGEKLHLDSGSTRFDATRLTNTDVQRFKLVLSPSTSRNVPSECEYSIGGPPTP